MVFTAPADAKAKKPHRLGLPCLGCEAMEASWWRGPAGRYCQGCKKEAAEARAALMADPKDKIINELTSRLASTEQGLQHALTEISKLVKRIDQHDKDLDDYDEELNEHHDAMKTLRVQISSRAQQELMGGKQSTPSTAKRPALGFVSCNAQRAVVPRL